MVKRNANALIVHCEDEFYFAFSNGYSDHQASQATQATQTTRPVKPSRLHRPPGQSSHPGQQCKLGPCKPNNSVQPEPFMSAKPVTSLKPVRPGEQHSNKINIPHELQNALFALQVTTSSCPAQAAPAHSHVASVMQQTVIFMVHYQIQCGLIKQLL